MTAVSPVSLGLASEDDAAAIASLRTAVAARLTEEHGRGHWSSGASESGVVRTLRSAKVLVARSGHDIVATLTLALRKPWAIDPEYFTGVARPLYLTDMAVAPELQRRGIGRSLLEEATVLARGWPADAIRLDAYDSAAGAGDFYAKCGFSERGRVTYRRTALVYFELLLDRSPAASARGRP